MPMTLTGDNMIVVSEEAREQATAIVDDARDSVMSGLQVAIDGRFVPVPDELAKLMVHIIQRAAHGGACTLTSMPDELTTTVAADLMGVSRPTLMKFVRSGDLPSHMVGSHTRLRTQDVLAFQKVREELRRRAIEDLSELRAQLEGAE